MKLQDLGWPHLVLKDKHRRTSQSLPTLKASLTRSLIKLRARAVDPSFARSSEDLNVNVYQPLRLLEPRPEPESRSPTPQNLSPDNSNTPYLLHTTLNTTNDPSQPSQALPPPNSAMRLRGSGTVSPLSDGSVNDLMPTPSNSRDSFGLSEQYNAPAEGILIPSIDDLVHARYGHPKDSRALGTVSNGLSSALAAMQASGSLPSMHSLVIEASTYDGPALEMHPTKLMDSSNTRAGHFPPIPDDTESVLSIDLPMSDLNAAEIASLRGSITKQQKATKSMLTIGDNLPMSTNLPTDSMPDSISVLRAQEVPKGSRHQDIPAIQSSSMLPIDTTGFAIEPSIPVLNQTKKHKLKIKAKKVVRYARRLALRKPVLTLVLGKQLAGPTQIALKMASRLESAGSEALTAAEPVTASNVPVAGPGPVLL